MKLLAQTELSRPHAYLYCQTSQASLFVSKHTAFCSECGNKFTFSKVNPFTQKIYCSKCGRGYDYKKDEVIISKAYNVELPYITMLKLYELKNKIELRIYYNSISIGSDNVLNFSKIKEIKINGQKVTATIDEDKTAKVKYPVTENGTINIEVTDEAGNVTTKTITVDKIDNKGPEVTITGNPENWTNKDATLHVKAKDDASGIEKVTITQVVNGKEESKDVNFTTNEDGSIDLDYTVDKNQTIKISVTDKAGNTTTKTIVVDKIDKEKPTLKAPTAVATTNTVTVTFNQTDALSGIDEETIRYAIRKQGEDEWEIVQNSEKVNTFIKRTKDTLYEVKTIAKDKAGNEMESEIVIVRTLNLTEPLIKQNPETITNCKSYNIST